MYSLGWLIQRLPVQLWFIFLPKRTLITLSTSRTHNWIMIPAAPKRNMVIEAKEREKKNDVDIKGVFTLIVLVLLVCLYLFFTKKNIWFLQPNIQMHKAQKVHILWRSSLNIQNSVLFGGLWWYFYHLRTFEVSKICKWVRTAPRLPLSNTKMRICRKKINPY